MQTLFIEAQKKLELNREKLRELEKTLPSTIYITYSIQFKSLALEVKKELEKSEKVKIFGFSQILGCSEIKTGASAILLIGEARFHAINLSTFSGKEVYVFDNYATSKISKEEIDSLEKKEKGKYLKFLSSLEVGIIISSKSGQENLKLGEEIKLKLEKQGKKAFLFLADNINPAELENFTLPIYVNTACPGLELDSSKIINYRTIKEYSKCQAN